MRGLIVVLCLSAASVGEAATLYVNNSGAPACSDATVKASNTAAAPWCTIARAAWGSTTFASPNTSEAASAGDVVLITAGTYTENGNSSGTNYTPHLQPANSGTAGNVITFRGVGTVEIRMNDNFSGPTIGGYTRNYIVWDHFTINDYYQGSVSDTGPVVFNNSTGGQLLNSTISGHTGSYYNGQATFGGNYRLVTLEDATAITVKNNRIHRAHLDGSGVGGQNEAGIMLYDSADNIIEHNEVYDCGTGIFVKGQQNGPDTQTDNIIRYNYVYDADDTGIRVWGGPRTLIYQNIVTTSTTGISFQSDESYSSRIINNTLYDNDKAFIIYENVAVSDLDYSNNLIASSTYGIYNWPSATYAWIDVAFVRNWYYTVSTHFYGEGIGTINFATWQGTHSEDVDGVNGTDPSFTNAAGGNFHIANATALVTGRVVESVGGTNGATIPVGAYISGTEEIGVEAASASTSVISGGVRFTGSVRIQ